MIATIQDFDARGVTRFDEPVGIAFAGNRKAYVALSSRDEIAIIDIHEGRHHVRPQRIRITAQDPRAIAVRGDRLYVAAFESNNQTELSVCPHADGTEQCTIGIADPPPAPGETPPPIDIVRDPNAPDRDLFVYDTEDDTLVDVVSHVGTLLYGIAVGADGRVFVAHTEARNEVSGPQQSTLPALQNRIYLNRIASVDCRGETCSLSDERLWELEPAPGQPILEGRQLATPYGIAVSDDGATLVVTAAASGRVFTVDTRRGRVRGVVDVGDGPRGIALRSSRKSGKARRAFVLNTLGNSVSVVDVSRPERLRVIATIPVGNDPTPDEVRRGRIAFNAAHASSSGTFACASCHPDAHTDHLAWRIGASRLHNGQVGPQEPRVTQSIRGLRNTLPLHWDGILGDPFGGPNGFVGAAGSEPPDCAIAADRDDQACFLDLVLASLSAVMCDQTGDCPPGGNELSDEERRAIATYMASVWHAPARDRPIDDQVSQSARRGFSDFHVDQGGIDRGTCASSGCHELPLLAGTNVTGPNDGFDAPSLRGMTDRFILFKNGINAPHEVQLFLNDPVGLKPPFDASFPAEIPFDPAIGYTEGASFTTNFLVFRPTMNVGPLDILSMFGEMSTGTSGAVGRQVTLAASSLDASTAPATLALLDSLEEASRRGVVALVGVATGREWDHARQVHYEPAEDAYHAGSQVLARDELIALVESQQALITLTAHLPARFGTGIHRQPLLWLATRGPGATGDPSLPVVTNTPAIALRGTDVRRGAAIFVNGEPAAGSIQCLFGGQYVPEFCSTGFLLITLAQRPSNGLQLLQVQNPEGPLSNEFPFCVGSAAACR